MTHTLGDPSGPCQAGVSNAATAEAGALFGPTISTTNSTWCSGPDFCAIEGAGGSTDVDVGLPNELLTTGRRTLIRELEPDSSANLPVHGRAG